MNAAAEVRARAEGSVLRGAAAFVAEYRLQIVAISAALLVPCFWHRRIVASDLGSHLYNAWLVQLIDHRQVTGLRLAHQWTNVLFDLMLGSVGTFFSLNTAEKVAVSAAVLIFFWGAFALVCAATRRAPWYLTPFLALATYGWTFHLGLFNYYLSLGLSFWGIALFWRGKDRERWLALLLAPVILLAHPLGLVWLVAACAYVAIAELLPLWLQWILFAAAIGVVDGVRHLILSRYSIQESLGSFLKYNGADQLVLFSNRYGALKTAVIVITLGMLVIDVVCKTMRRAPMRDYVIPLQLYAVIAVAVKLLPSGISISSDLAAVAILTERLTSLAAVLACCALGAMLPSRWHLVATASIAAVFFVYVYQDTAIVNRMETQAEHLVRTLPRNSRVMATIYPLPDSRILIQHVIDRACIGYCFSYGNYEPGTALFRVRGVERGDYNVGDYGLAVDMEEGEYVVQPEDLPLWQVYQCTKDGTELCIAPLHASEKNNEMAVYGSD